MRGGLWGGGPGRALWAGHGKSGLRGSVGAPGTFLGLLAVRPSVQDPSNRNAPLFPSVHRFSQLFIHLSVHLSSTSPPTHCPASSTFTHLSVLQSICPSTHLSILTLTNPTVNTHVHSSTHRSVHPLICPSIHPSIHHPPILPSIDPSSILLSLHLLVPLSSQAALTAAHPAWSEGWVGGLGEGSGPGCVLKGSAALGALPSTSGLWFCGAAARKALGTQRVGEVSPDCEGGAVTCTAGFLQELPVLPRRQGGLAAL